MKPKHQLPISEQATMLIPNEGCILQVPSELTEHDCAGLVEQIRKLWPNRKVLIVAGDVSKLSEVEMAEHGWYRK